MTASPSGLWMAAWRHLQKQASRRVVRLSYTGLAFASATFKGCFSAAPKTGLRSRRLFGGANADKSQPQRMFLPLFLKRSVKGSREGSNSESGSSSGSSGGGRGGNGSSSRSARPVSSPKTVFGRMISSADDKTSRHVSTIPQGQLFASRTEN